MTLLAIVCGLVVFFEDSGYRDEFWGVQSMISVYSVTSPDITYLSPPQAFLEQYLRPGPTCQYSGVNVDQWTLLSEESVTGTLHSSLTFCLRGGDTQLVVSVSRIPRLTLSESFVPPNSHRFVVRLYPPVLDMSTISPA